MTKQPVPTTATPKLADIRKRLATEPLIRTFTIERSDVAAAGEGDRTVSLAFASDAPVEHWFGLLELSLKGKAMRTQRLDNGAPLLMDHNMTDVVGVVESYSIQSGKARAIVRFGESARAQEIFNDVQTGIRRNVSVGFMVHSMQLLNEKESNKGAIPLYRSEDWEPLEVSIVSVPADVSVGIGRSVQNQQMENKNKMVKEDRTLAEGESAEIAEAEEVRDWGRIFNENKTAEDYIKQSFVSGQAPTVEGFRQLLSAKRQTEQPSVKIPVEDPWAIATRAGVPAPFQPGRVISRHGAVRNFQGAGAEERAHSFGKWILGGPCGDAAARQWCQERGFISRAMSEFDNSKGGFLVPEQFGNDLIDLIETHGVFRRNAKIQPMESDTRSDPRVTNELEAEFVGESSAGNDQDLEYDRVLLTAKKAMVLVPYSSELSEDSTIVIGDQIAGHAARAFAKKEDNCGFNGDGSSTYGGITGVREKLKGLNGTIANIAGLKVGTGNAYSELTLADFRGVVALLPQYADSDRAAWYVSRSFYWNTMVGTMLASGGVTAAEVEDQRNQRFLGYRVEFTQVMPTVEANSQVCAILGDLAMGATFGERRMVRIAISDQVRFREDDLVFKATERFAINVHDVGNATAVAADRQVGPIVGLITAAS